jgi:hypothetical protein
MPGHHESLHASFQGEAQMPKKITRFRTVVRYALYSHLIAMAFLGASKMGDVFFRTLPRVSAIGLTVLYTVLTMLAFLVLPAERK